MFEFHYQLGRARRRLHRVLGEQCLVGSGRENDLVLKSRHLSRRHILLQQKHSGVFVRDLGSSGGTFVNRERVVEHGPLHVLDEVRFGDVGLWVAAGASGVVAREKIIDPPTPPGLDTLALRAATHAAAPDAEPAVDAERDYWISVIHKTLLQQMDLRRKDVNRMSDEVLRNESRVLINAVLEQIEADLPERLDRTLLAETVLDESVGLGPLQALLEDDSVTEIMVNNHREIFVERDGTLRRSAASFSSDQAVHAIIERIITPIGRRIDESSPIVDARLKDGSRVNAIIPPLALKGPSLTIRKFPGHRLHAEELVRQGSLSSDMMEFLHTAVRHRRNIVVSGGTGTGKTTLLNVLSAAIAPSERIVTIEDAAELRLAQPNLVTLEARPPNAEGRGEINIRELVKNALRMRPDRIIVGECRGGEALDMLQAMNTGHDGSLTTLHANSPRDMVSRLEVLVMMTGLELPMLAIREQIASAVDVIVQLTRFPCGARKVSSVTEITGVDSGIVQLQELFRYRRLGADANGQTQGQFETMGVMPGFYESLRAAGHAVNLESFQTDAGP